MSESGQKDQFTWGLEIARFQYDFDGRSVEVVKYHPWESRNSIVYRGSPDKSAVLYSCEALHESFGNLDDLLISWIANKNLGLNQSALVRGICRALATD